MNHQSPIHFHIVCLVASCVTLWTATGCTDCSKSANRDACEDSVFYEDGGSDGSTGGTGTDGSGGTSLGGAGTGTGSSGPGPGTGATSGAPEPDVVWEWGKADNEPVITSGGWVIDSTLGAHSGETAVHPPAFEAGDEYTFTVDCGGEDHTQFRFQLSDASDAVQLELTVSGEEEPRVLPGRTYLDRFEQKIINVEPGPHTYTFHVSSAVDASPSVILDSFTCLVADPHAAENGYVDFDDEFIPSEVQGNWQVDNLLGVQGGDLAIHPPAFRAGDEYTFTVDCGGEDHTQFRFQLSDASDAVQLELTVSGEEEPRVLPARTYLDRFEQKIINVEPGPHTYTFHVSSAVDAGPSVVLDSFACLGTEPTVAENGHVDFDDGFIPVEVESTWHLDNLLGVHGGEAAVHPPAFVAGDAYTLVVECGDQAHAQLRFQLSDASNAVQLEMSVSGEDQPRVLPDRTYLDRFEEQIIDVEPGPHTYTFDAWSDVDSPPGVILDSFVCD